MPFSFSVYNVPVSNQHLGISVTVTYLIQRKYTQTKKLNTFAYVPEIPQKFVVESFENISLTVAYFPIKMYIF